MSPENSAIALMTFYAKPDSTFGELTGITSDACSTLAELNKHYPVIVVNDSDIRFEVNEKGNIYTHKPEHHLGKAGAVRTAITIGIEKYPKAKYLIYADLDSIESVKDVPDMLRELEKVDVVGEDYVMMVGERDQALEKQGFMDDHRRVLFAIQHDFCARLGFPNITDPTTGIRIIKKPLGEKFSAHGRGINFGSDSDQIIMCSVLGAKVIPYKLTKVEQRHSQTLISKFEDTRAALLAWEIELRGQGKNELVDLYGYSSAERIAQLVQSNLIQTGDSFRGQMEGN